MTTWLHSQCPTKCQGTLVVNTISVYYKASIYSLCLPLGNLYMYPKLKANGLLSAQLDIWQLIDWQRTSTLFVVWYVMHLPTSTTTSILIEKVTQFNKSLVCVCHEYIDIYHYLLRYLEIYTLYNMTSKNRYMVWSCSYHCSYLSPMGDFITYSCG